MKVCLSGQHSQLNLNFKRKRIKLSELCGVHFENVFRVVTLTATKL